MNGVAKSPFVVVKNEIFNPPSQMGSTALFCPDHQVHRDRALVAKAVRSLQFVQVAQDVQVGGDNPLVLKNTLRPGGGSRNSSRTTITTIQGSCRMGPAF